MGEEVAMETVGPGSCGQRGGQRAGEDGGTNVLCERHVGVLEGREGGRQRGRERGGRGKGRETGC